MVHRTGADPGHKDGGLARARAPRNDERSNRCADRPKAKQLIAFFQVLYSLNAVYRTSLPPEFYAAFSWLQWITFDPFDLCKHPHTPHGGRSRARY